MTFSDFENRYRDTEAGLETIVADLRAKIEQALVALGEERKKKGLQDRVVRVRLCEERPKKCGSLYRKIIGDRALNVSRAFEMGHVRDLIGARIVCHTLDDVKYLEESLKKDVFRGLHYVEPLKGVKDWSETPNADSGYRGLHLDVKWPRNALEFNCAELQLRTLLQDAWASLFHDDLYRDSAGVLPKKIYSMARALSDDLHALDKKAQAIIRDIATQRLYGAGRIKMLEAIDREMYAMAAVGASAIAKSPYSRVRRNDRYVVGPEALFDFTVDAECNKQEPFSFIIAGDTPNARMTIEAVEHIEPSGDSVTLSANQYSITRQSQPDRVVILTRPRWKAKRHRYRIVCHWAGVFDLPLESVWCPWGTMYPGAEVEYKLALEFLQKPHMDPRILSLAKFASLKAVHQAYADGKGEEGEYTYDKKTKHHIYRFEPNEAGDMLCFFMP